MPESQINHVANFAHGNLIFITGEPVPDAWDIFKRFAKVFEQTYTRFLDLKKAEAQAREAQIEAALEKVRSTSMGMHQSDELEKVVGILFDKLSELGLTFDGALICFFDKAKRDSKFWIATNHLSTPINIILPYDEEMAKNPIEKDLRSGKDILNKSYSGTVKNDYFRYTARHNEKIPESIRKFHLEQKAWTVTFAAEKNSLVGVDGWHGQTTSIENFQILKRFARVFEQAYVRFLDLQNAEAQAREAQIETALEKVRSRSMAMQKSTELREVVAVVYQQMRRLGFDNKLCNILLFDPATLDVDYWLSFNEQEILPGSYHVPKVDHPVYRYQLNAWKNESPFDAFVLSGDLKTNWDDYISNQTDIKKIVASAKESIHKLEKIILSSVATKNGLLQTATVEPLSDESISILQRFAKVFDQSYTRFLDLQTAEAQAREAQIEAALEKVRSSSMGMHHSDELEKVVTVLFDKLSELGLSFDGALIYNFDKEKRNIQLWVASKLLSAPVKVKLPHDDEIAKNPIIEDLWRAIEKGEHVLNKSYSGKTKDDYFLYVAKNNENNVAQAVRDLQFRRAIP